jgi:hypothetical protein
VGLSVLLEVVFVGCFGLWVTVMEGLLSGSVWFLIVFFANVVKTSRAGSLIFGGELGLRCVVYQKPFQIRVVR